jgi:hypothetical protein
LKCFTQHLQQNNKTILRIQNTYATYVPRWFICLPNTVHKL